mmetsp:Transcript_16411/g.19990  ORF Transcript_16411/g.19990 Transcript_16411/m.19990 type:complete len:171 (-) Transcript_16411:1036-1548(-)
MECLFVFKTQIVDILCKANTILRLSVSRTDKAVTNCLCSYSIVRNAIFYFNPQVVPIKSVFVRRISFPPKNPFEEKLKNIVAWFMQKGVLSHGNDINLAQREINSGSDPRPTRTLCPAPFPNPNLAAAFGTLQFPLVAGIDFTAAGLFHPRQFLLQEHTATLIVAVGTQV